MKLLHWIEAFYISDVQNNSRDLSMDLTENEIKYTISNARHHHVIRWLRCRCHVDTKFHAETVSSIYYDTWGWKSLYEKLNSDYLKTKIRLRWYSDVAYLRHDKLSFAEAKFRIGTKRNKIRIETPYSGEWIAKTALNNPVLLKIPSLLATHGATRGENYFPVYQISYKRLRFRDPISDTTICFDYDIAMPRLNPFMLPNGRPCALQTAVLELKGAVNQIPVFVRPVVELGFKKESFSKYGACFQKMAERAR